MKKYLSILLAICVMMLGAFPVYAVGSEYRLEVSTSSDVYGPEDSIIISGTVYKDGNTLANAEVIIQVTQRNSSIPSFVAQIITDNEGKFTCKKEQIRDLEFDDYIVKVDSVGLTKTLEFKVEDTKERSKIVGVDESYYQGEDVNITVVAYSDEILQSNADVTIKVSFDERPVKVSQGLTDSNGEYSIVYKLADDTKIGTYNIEATVLGDEIAKEFNVKEKIAVILESIKIVSSKTKLKVDKTLALNLEGMMNNGTKAPESELKNTVWSSSDSDIATVDSNGLVKGVSEGTVTIIAKIGGLSDEKTLTIEAKSDSGDSGSGGSGGGGSSSSDKEDSKVVEAEVPTTGGTVKDEKGNIELVFEKGTFDKKAEVKVELVEKVTEPQASHSITRVADVYEFTSSIEEFNKPVILRIKYNKSKLNGISEELLGVYTLNEKTDEWEYVGGKVDKENEVVEVVLNHFSKYTVMASTRTFADIANHWAETEIKAIAARQIVDGMDGINYAPQGTMTKAQFAKTLVTLLGLEQEEHTGTFTDIEGKWYTGYVEAALKAGIVTATETTFNPDVAITREEMAVMVANTIKYEDEAKATVAELTFEDKDQITETALEAVAVAFNNGIIKGRTETTFVPQGTATRAEAAAMIYRLLQVLDRI